MKKNIKNNLLKFLIIYYPILKMGKFLNWDILLPMILDPCLLIPFPLINFNIKLSKLILSILLIQDFLMI
jgi:hypothetical protein